MPLDEKQLIPKVMHFVWFGGDLPADFQENIRQWKRLNPEFKLNLWIQESKSEQPNIKKLEDEGIQIQEINANRSNFLNYDLVLKELQKKPPNFSAASDILRIDLIAELGGYYFDVGIVPEKPIPATTKNLQASLEKNSDPKESFIGNNNVHAAIPKHPIYREAQSLLKRFDKILSDNKLQDTNDSDINYLVTRTRTGKAFYFALQLLEKELEQPLEQYSLEAHTVGKAKSQTKAKRKIGADAFRAAQPKEKQIFDLIQNEVITPTLMREEKQIIDAFFAEYHPGLKSYWNDQNRKTATLAKILEHANKKNDIGMFGFSGNNTLKTLTEKFHITPKEIQEKNLASIKRKILENSQEFKKPHRSDPAKN